jgi:hypothetical protein
VRAATAPAVMPSVNGAVESAVAPPVAPPVGPAVEPPVVAAPVHGRPAAQVPRAPAAVAAPAAAPSAAPAAAPVQVPAALEAATVTDDDDTCTEESCARHGNERECCTPFRAHVATLDRAAISTTTAAIRAQVHDCRDPQSSDGLVRISVVVLADGSVAKASVLESPEVTVGRCVAELVRGLTFPATDNGGTFVYRAQLSAD